MKGSEIIEFRTGDYLVRSNAHGVVQCYSVLPNDRLCGRPGWVYEHYRGEDLLEELAMCDFCRSCITEAPN